MTHPWDPDDILCLLKPFFGKIILISKSTIVIALLTKHVVSALEWCIAMKSDVDLFLRCWWRSKFIKDLNSAFKFVCL